MEQQQVNGLFLFSTNNIGGMQLYNLPEEEKINDTKWNTLKFPENCKIIKKIVCGAEFVAICNEKNEIYYFGNFGNFGTSRIHFWNQLIIESNLKNNLKNLYASYLNLIIQLDSDNITIFNNDTTSTTLNFNCGIKMIFTGPLSTQFIVIGKNNKVYEISSDFKQTEIDTSEIDKNSIIKRIAFSTRANLLVTSDNKIYGYGSSSFGELGDLQSSLYEFEYMSTPFEKESEIVDVKGGYYHFVVLLKSGIVYAIGYNNIGAVNVYNQNSFNHFIRLTHPLFENEFINRIYCSSRGTVLITKSNYAYFIGEVVYGLTGYDCDNSIDENIQSYKSKSLQYFEKKLLNLIKEPHFSDISIILFVTEYYYFN
ncbi:hypothetical protein ABK040_008547 [Willaertia magna]